MDKPRVYRMIDRPIPRWDDPTGTWRMRSLLKSMLRFYSVRCIKFEAVQPQDDAAADRADKGNTEADCDS